MTEPISHYFVFMVMLIGSLFSLSWAFAYVATRTHTTRLTLAVTWLVFITCVIGIGAFWLQYADVLDGLADAL